MAGTSVEVGDLIYEVVAPFTSITDYGVNVQAILSGAESPPAEGAQIDFAFQGTFCGPRLSRPKSLLSSWWRPPDSPGRLLLGL